MKREPVDSSADEMHPLHAPTERVFKRRHVGGCEGCEATGSYVAFCSNSRLVQRVGAQGGVALELEAGESEIVTFVEIRRSAGVEFAPLGLTQMLNPGGAVLSLTARAQGKNAVCFGVGFRGCGEFSVACNAPPVSCRILEVNAQGDISPQAVVVDFEFKEVVGVVEVAIPEIRGLRGIIEFVFASG
jgi:hypothetical protein